MTIEQPNAVVVEPADDEISLFDLALVLAENLRLSIVVPLAAGLLALGIGFPIPPTFTATARILPQRQQSSAAALDARRMLERAANISAGIRYRIISIAVDDHDAEACSRHDQRVHGGATKTHQTHRRDRSTATAALLRDAAQAIEGQPYKGRDRAAVVDGLKDLGEAITAAFPRTTV